MKLILNFSLIIIFSIQLSAQTYWSSPKALTDTLSDNKNGYIVCIDNSESGIQDSVFLFWEKVHDENSSSIYYREIISMSEPKEILSKNDVHFKNPQAMKYILETDTIFYLFYETDQNGPFDIYYLKYLKNGSFSEPLPFVVSEFDDKNLNTCHNSIVWERNGKILFSKYAFIDEKYQLLEPQIITEGNCSNPDIYDHEIIVWQEDVLAESKIYHSRWDNINDIWTTPDILYDLGDNINISTSKHSFGNPIVSWQNKQETIWNILTYDTYEDKIYHLDVMPSHNKIEPSVFYYPQVTKTNYELPYETICTFVLDSIPENTEIYSNSDLNRMSAFDNISNNDVNDHHPFLYEGRQINTAEMEVYNVWESYINSNRQLYMSKIILHNSAIDDKSDIVKLEKPTLKQNYPNPFNPYTMIEYYVPQRGRIVIEIFDLSGRMIKSLVDGVKHSGIHNIYWNGTNTSNRKVSSGTYFIRLRDDKNRIVQRKMLLLK